MAIQTDPALAGEAHEAQRARQIHQIIARSFDFPFMAKDALGSASGHLNQDFVTTFSYLFQDSYTRMVVQFLKKENITYNQERLEGSKARVDTTIVRPNESIPVTTLTGSLPSLRQYSRKRYSKQRPAPSSTYRSFTVGPISLL